MIHMSSNIFLDKYFFLLYIYWREVRGIQTPIAKPTYVSIVNKESTIKLNERRCGISSPIKIKRRYSMKISYISIAVILLMSICLLQSYPLHISHSEPSSDGAFTSYFTDNPPPIDSINLVFSGIDYGGDANSPQSYPHAKHIVNVKVGSYYFPVVTWETDLAWNFQSLFSYWDDLFQFWSYPDSFTSGLGYDTGRPAMVSDSKGNLHFCWHQKGNPDGYEVYYTRAFLDTSGGVVLYNVERPATMLSVTNGQEETFPCLQIYEDTLVMVVFPRRTGSNRNAIAYNYSTDGGNTWAGEALAYDHGGTIPGGWIECSMGVNQNNGDMWAAFNMDMSGDGSMDIVALRWNAATQIWTNEIAAAATTMHPYACPAIVIDSNNQPHILFQENHINDGGVAGNLSVFYASGPFGYLYYTFKSGGSWYSPMQIDLPRSEPSCNLCSGWASAGIAADNTIYFALTQPESAAPDTTAYGSFNVHYAELSPYTGALSYGGPVTTIPPTDSLNSIYPHMVYHVYADGPGITWAQMVNSLPPSDVYYCHKDTLAGIEEDEKGFESRPIILYQNYPNPVNTKTMIRFTIPSNKGISLDIYDISGRHVKRLAGGIPHAGSYFTVWDGKDSKGMKVPGGVYLYTLKVGSYSETKKLLLVH
jgi:hypothetical protein